MFSHKKTFKTLKRKRDETWDKLNLSVTLLNLGDKTPFAVTALLNSSYTQSFILIIEFDFWYYHNDVYDDFELKDIKKQGYFVV